jgi:alpha(1,3/1,4) fucosyltransferase
VKPKLKIHFADFWPTFHLREFWMYEMLNELFEITLSPISPDLVIFCHYGISHLSYRCHKIFYSHENTAADSNLCDYSFCFHGEGRGHCYFSNFIEDEFFEQIRSGTFGARLLEIRSVPKAKFCNFVYANPKPQERIRLCRQLMQYKRVDCPGPVLNNHPPFAPHDYRYRGKVEFLSNYKFTIAFENETAEDYTTEKLFHPLVAGSIPIYWGNPRAGELFNPSSFINCHDYDSFDSVIREVIRIDRDEGLLKSYVSARAILPGSRLSKFSADFLRSRLSHIGTALASTTPVSRNALYPAISSFHYLSHKINNRILYFFEVLQNISRNKGSAI